MKTTTNRRKFMAVMASLGLVSAVAFSGCGSSDKGSDKAGPVVVANAAYVDETAAGSLKEALNAALPDMNIDVISISVGDTEKDPMGAAAGIMKLTTMVAGKEADVLISDYESAKRNAANEMYYTLTDLFTEEELQPYESRIISFDKLDSEGKATGEKYEYCGIEVSDNEILSKLFAGSDAGVYIVSNTTDLESAKTIFMRLVSQEF